MQVEEKIIHKYCDLCGAEVTEFMKASETSGVQILITEIIPYAGQKHYTEICEDCNMKIISFMKKLKED